MGVGRLSILSKAGYSPPPPREKELKKLVVDPKPIFQFGTRVFWKFWNHRAVFHHLELVFSQIWNDFLFLDWLKKGGRDPIARFSVGNKKHTLEHIIFLNLPRASTRSSVLALLRAADGLPGTTEHRISSH